MKKLLLAGIFALLMPFTTTLYAANTATANIANTAGTTDTAKPDLEEIARRFEQKAEQEAKKELKGLVQENTLKKDLAASRGTQPNGPNSTSERLKREAINTAN